MSLGVLYVRVYVCPTFSIPVHNIHHVKCHEDPGKQLMPFYHFFYQNFINEEDLHKHYFVFHKRLTVCAFN